LSIAADAVQDVAQLDDLLARFEDLKKNAPKLAGQVIETEIDGKPAQVKADSAVRSVARDVLNLKRLFDCVGGGA
jgi:hypothetical protein